MRLPESVGLLVDIVAVPSPTGHEEDAARMLADRLPRFGWETSHLDGAGSVIATRGNGDKELVLLSHIDTVPGGPKLFVNEERVEVPRDWRIPVVAAVGEEIDSRGARFRMPLHEPAALVVGEPTGSNGVALSYRGRILFSFVAEDSGAHRSGSPGPMSDTVLAAASMMQITENMGKGYSIAIMEMEGHEAGRRSASITMDLRTPIGAQQEELELMLNETAAAFGVGLNVIEYVPPHEVHKSDPVIRAFRTAIRDVTGEPPRVLAKQGTCDFNVLSTWGCPMGAFGPGDSKYDHSSNEQIEIKEFLRGVEVVKGALPKVMEAIR